MFSMRNKVASLYKFYFPLQIEWDCKYKVVSSKLI
jgi:hypothetical protein